MSFIWEKLLSTEAVPTGIERQMFARALMLGNIVISISLVVSSVNWKYRVPYVVKNIRYIGLRMAPECVSENKFSQGGGMPPDPLVMAALHMPAIHAAPLIYYIHHFAPPCQNVRM